MFSPFYAWAGRREPLDHCALNVCLYGPGASRWALTERRRDAVTAASGELAIGPSQVRAENGTLVFDIREHGAPLPRPVRGRVVIRPEAEQEETFVLDASGRHVWRPVWPRAHVEVRFDSPAIAWSGDGYVDMNAGVEPLESGFQSWSWARTAMPDGAAILYDCRLKSGQEAGHALRIGRDGRAERFEPPPHAALPAVAWGVRRPGRSDGAARVVRTLEDTPFYSRSLIETELLGERRVSMHESLDLERFSSSWVKLLLPFRMRRAF